MGAADRARARAALRERRTALEAPARAACDAAIVAALLDLVDALAPSSLAAYWPMLGEPDPRLAFECWHRSGIVMALPRVVGADAALSFERWEPGMPLQRGPFGTLHPVPGAPVRPDLLLIPCLGFDRRGYRLGYGGGFYDRTLAVLGPVATVGIGYSFCEVTGFAPDPHDHPLQRIVTDREVLGPFPAPVR